MSLLQDLRFALRLLVKDRWFSAAADTALALGIGVNATVFTLVNAVLMRGLPFAEPDRLYVLGVKPRDVDRGGETISRPDLLDWRPARRPTRAWRSGPRDDDRERRPDAPEPRRASGSRPARSTLLRQPMLLGRDFRPATTSPGAERVVILGHALWQARYRGDRGVLGLPVRINGEPATVVGVMPPGMKFPTNADLWVSAIPTRDKRDGAHRSLPVFGRLKPGDRCPQAQPSSTASSSGSPPRIRRPTRSSAPR